jgi:nicotinate-nucleotide pyrophosphorylase (carboxylating)
MKSKSLTSFLIESLAEDIGDGDHSSLASVPAGATGRARLAVKESGIIAGLRIARYTAGNCR